MFRSWRLRKNLEFSFTVIHVFLGYGNKTGFHRKKNGNFTLELASNFSRTVEDTSNRFVLITDAMDGR